MKLLASSVALTCTILLAACTSDADNVTEGKVTVTPGEAPAAEAPKEEPKMMTTDSGLQYEVLTEGTGASPSATDSVTVHYAGTLTDGTEFDSSYKRGQPATFPLNRVIAGWTEGLQLMKEGAKYRFTIPPALGYGKRGVPGTIPPDSTLVFEVELIEVQ